MAINICSPKSSQVLSRPAAALKGHWRQLIPNIRSHLPSDEMFYVTEALLYAATILKAWLHYSTVSKQII